MGMRLEATFSLLILATTIALSNCGLAGAPRDKILKITTVSDRLDLAAISPDGAILAAVDKTNLSSGNYAIKIIQISDGRAKYSTEKYPVYDVAFSYDGSMLAASCSDGVRVFRTIDGQLLRTFEGNQLFSVAFSPNGETLASGGAQGEVEIWRVNDGILIRKYSVGKWITSLAFSSNGEVLAAGTSTNIGFVIRSEASTENSPILLWRVNEAQSLATLTGHKYGVLSLAFSSDGKILASGGSDGVVNLWHIQEQTLLKSNQIATDTSPAERPQATINHLVFSPNGQSLAVAIDKEIVLLDSDTLNTVLALKGHTKAVLRLRFDRQGTALASVSEDKTIRLWKLD